MKGYLGIGPEEDKFVPSDRVYDYALERCLDGTPEEQAEFKEMLVDWYFSGNWIKMEGLE